MDFYIWLKLHRDNKVRVLKMGTKVDATDIYNGKSYIVLMLCHADTGEILENRDSM
jgi:hypothetical protein